MLFTYLPMLFTYLYNKTFIIPLVIICMFFVGDANSDTVTKYVFAEEVSDGSGLSFIANESVSTVYPGGTFDTNNSYC